MKKLFNIFLLSFLILSFIGFAQEIDSLVFKTDRLLELGIKSKAFPGAQVLIFKNAHFKTCHFCKQTNIRPCAGFDVISTFSGPLVANARNFDPKDSGAQNLSQF